MKEDHRLACVSFPLPRGPASPSVGQKKGKLKQQLFEGAGTNGSNKLTGMKTTASDTDFKHF